MKHSLVLLIMVISCTSHQQEARTVQAEATGKSLTEKTVISYGPSSVVRTIKQDRKGNIWITSWEGVFKYDGTSFTNVTSNVTTARFFSLLEDRNGNFWFGSIGSGVFYYDGITFINFTTNEGLISNEIGYIYEDKSGNIWLGGSGGVSRYDGRSFRNYVIDDTGMKPDATGKTFSERQPFAVISILQDRKGMFWFGTTANTFIFDDKTFSPFTYNGKPFKNIFTIIEDRKGNIWLGGTRYDGNTFLNLSDSSILCLYEDRNGNIWTTSAGSPSDNNWILSRYDANSISNQKPDVTILRPEVGPLFTILESYDGSIWLGSDAHIVTTATSFITSNVITNF